MQALRKSDVNMESPVSTLGVPDGFVTVSDTDTIQICNNYLEKAWDSKREFRALAKQLGLSASSVCALLQDTQRINGKRYDVLHFVMEPNPKFGPALLECGAIPDNLLKGWMIPCNEESISVVRRILCKYFGMVLCTQNNKVGIYENKLFREASKAPAQLHNEPVTVSLNGLRNAIIAARPSEKLDQQQMSIFDGNAFINLSGDVHTRLPWIVIRYISSDNKPRFAMMNTLSWKIEVVTFGAASVGTKLLLDSIKCEVDAIVGTQPIISIGT